MWGASDLATTLRASRSSLSRPESIDDRQVAELALAGKILSGCLAPGLRRDGSCLGDPGAREGEHPLTVGAASDTPTNATNATAASDAWRRNRNSSLVAASEIAMPPLSADCAFLDTPGRRDSPSTLLQSAVRDDRREGSCVATLVVFVQEAPSPRITSRGRVSVGSRALNPSHGACPQCPCRVVE